MFRRLRRAVALGSGLLLLLAPAAHAQTDPVAVFRQAVEARNRGDLAGIMAVFADDAVRQDGTCTPPCVGTAAIRRSFEQNIEERHQATVLAAQAAGNTVTARAELRNDRFRSLGAERVITLFTVELRDGKIVRWTSTLDGSDAQTAAYQAALRAQASPTPTAPAQLPRTGESDRVPALALAVGALAASLGFGLRRQAATAPKNEIEEA
jgi:LPXTG-motif cell wall-anchored protein